MCGIAGFYHHGSRRPADPHVLQGMVDTLRHRGPDEEGIWVGDGVALGMRRLRVIDPAGGRQPIASEDGAVRVVFNGEIYNHEDLRAQLESRGHRFRTRSDTEVIVHGYEEWGDACVERFNGMFAFGLWDARDRRLLLARDRLGIKPLYVHEGAGTVVFGSELKAVVASPEVPVEWDLDAVEDFLTYEYVPGPASIVRGVRKLAPGTTVAYGPDGRGTPRVYWRLEKGEPPPTRSAAVEGVRERLERAVQRRLIADVPLGAFLSGGVDSSVIVGIMSGLVPDVRTFSIGFDDPSYNELPYARLAAARFGTRHTDEVIDPGVLEMAPALNDLFDEPFGDVSSFPTFLVSSVARSEVTVALSGDGGDELFAGYDAYRAQRFASRSGLSRVPGLGRTLDGVLRYLPPGTAKKGFRNASKRFAEGLARPRALQHARWMVFWGPAARDRLLTPSFASELGDRNPYGYYIDRLREGKERGFRGLAQQLYADLTGYLLEDILVKVDRMSMGVSLEARVPFLDHEVVEYAMSIPDSWKLRRGTTKWILKEAFDDLLPVEIQRRKKEGFSTPMKHWLRGPLRPAMLDLLSAERLGGRGWFRPPALETLIDEHLSGRANHAHRLWCLMSLEMSLSSISRRTPAARSGTAGPAP